MLNLKKSIFLLVSLVAAVVANAWTGSYSEPENSRKIGGKIYYELTNADELAWFAVRVNGGDTVNAIMVNDIDVSGYRWTPIGNVDIAFEGVFDGAGYTVSGIDCTNKNESGFFGIIGENGVVKNLKTAGGSIGIDARSGIAGGIAAVNKGIIDSCESSVTLRKTMFTGGIVGKNEGRIIHCVNSAEINVIDDNGSKDGNPTFYVGGVSAYNEGDIKFCNNVGKIKYTIRWGTTLPIGGLAGFNSGLITRSNNMDSVYVTTNWDCDYIYAGGIVGINEGDVAFVSNVGVVFVQNNYTSRQGALDVGGVTGHNKGKIRNVFNTNDYGVVAWGTASNSFSISGLDYWLDGVNVSSTSENMQRDQFAWILNTSNGDLQILELGVVRMM